MKDYVMDLLTPRSWRERVAIVAGIVLVTFATSGQWHL